MLQSGSRVGAYEILAPLGAGGMGEVYRAKDARLDRDVALKVLAEEFFEDRDRVVRFEREAKSLAALNHPGIAAIYSFEEVSGRHLLVMELVEGEGLDARIASGPLPVGETLSYARQIAEALEAAHEKGIIHRDLKPANVKVTPDGRVKLLDFGLAKIFEGDGGPGSSPNVTHSPTLTARATAAGVILGTAAYMSPEQARGKALDKRTDVWAFGCVLYEMLTGRRAFEGETVSDTLAAVLKEDPNWAALPEPTPAAVRKVLRRCLQRDAKLRLHDIADARLDLEELAASTASGSSPFEEKTADSNSAGASAERASRERGSRRSFWIAWGVAAAFAAAAGALALRARAPGSAPVVRLSIPLPPGQILTGNSGPAISRDGRTLAYTARDAAGVSRLYVRALDRFDSSVIPESEGAQQPFFSPDGGRVGFFARGKLLTASLSGGAPTAIADASSQPFGGTWGEDDTIIFVPTLTSGLLRIPSSGDKPRNLTEPDEAAGGYAHAWPQFLPGGRTVLFTIWGGTNAAANGAAMLSLETGKWTSVAPGVESFRYARSGHLLESEPRGVMAAAFDPTRPQQVRVQTFVVDDVFRTPAATNSWFSTSDTGTLVYVPGDPILSALAWVDREGRVTPIADQAASVVDPSLSPDGTRAVLEDKDPSLWVVDLRRGTRSRLTLDHEGSNAYPVWSRDGRRVLFASNRSGDWDLYDVSAGGGPARRLLARRGNQFPASEAPDGTLLFMERAKGSAADLWTLSPDGTVAPFLVSPFSKVDAQFSPDGLAVAYVSDETGREEVYVRSVARPGDAVALSTEGGREPRWSPDGKEIFYRRGDSFFAARLASTGPLSVRDSKKLFEIRAASGRSQLHGGYAVSPDGRQFLVLLLDRRAIPTQINVVLNWFEELKAKVPAR
jgi:serine/threonine protein kinase/Tol biopolymer transport system component